MTLQRYCKEVQTEAAVRIKCGLPLPDLGPGLVNQMLMRQLRRMYKAN